MNTNDSHSISENLDMRIGFVWECQSYKALLSLREESGKRVKSLTAMLTKQRAHGAIGKSTTIVHDAFNVIQRWKHNAFTAICKKDGSTREESSSSKIK